MKTKMQDMQATITEKNRRSAEKEKEIANLRERYRVAIQSQNLMRRQIYEGEDRLEILEKDIKEVTRRLYDKEEYLRELHIFKPGDSIQEAARMDNKLLMKKQMYKENYDKFQKARQRKFALESKQDLIGCTLRAVNSKVSALKSELHHLGLENERKEEETRKSAENALLHSSGFEKLEIDIENIKRRVMEASKRMNSFTMQVSNKETEIRSIKFNRVNMENTIKNILRKVQENIARSSVSEM